MSGLSSPAADAGRRSVLSSEGRGVRIGVLALSPLILLGLAAYLYKAFAGFDTDPDYTYLLNAINILHLRQPDLYVHPGTTVEVIGSVVMGLFGLIRGFVAVSSIQTDVLLHPELYLVAIDVAVLWMIVAAVSFLGWQVWRFTGSLVVAFIAQASVFLSGVVMQSGLVKVAPESFLLFASVMVAGFSVPFVFGPDRSSTRRASIGLGVAIGFSLATKINALPLVFAVFYIGENRNRVTAIGAIAVSAIFFTLPITHQYFHIFRTYFSFATHTGAYGDGADGLPPVSTLIDHLRGLVAGNPEMFLDIVACVIGFMVVARQRIRGARFFVVSAAILVMQVVLVTKTGSSHYLMPAVGICCLVNAAVARLIANASGASRATWAVIGIGLLLVGWSREVVDTRSLATQRVAVNLEVQRLLTMVADSGCTPIYYHNTPVRVYQLEFGDQWADNRYGRSLNELYPNSLFYDFSGRALESFGTMIGRAAEQDRLSAVRCVYLVGGALENFTGGNLPKESLSLIASANEGTNLSIYELHRVADGLWPALSPLP